MKGREGERESAYGWVEIKERLKEGEGRQKGLEEGGSIYKQVKEKERKQNRRFMLAKLVLAELEYVVQLTWYLKIRHHHKRHK